MDRTDGMNYAPVGKPRPVVEPGQFIIAAIGLDHGHVYGMVNGLLEAGAQVKWVYDPDPAKAEKFKQTYPQVRIASSEEQVLADPEVRLVAAAAITSQRCALGLRVMDAGKDYFTDKAPFTTLEQLEQARTKVRETGKKYAVYYSERLHDEAALYAGCKDAKVLHSKIANYTCPQYPELDDFGDATLLGDNGATNYFRVDWLTPDGLSVWGDGRAIILGTEGYIELRKNVDIARDRSRAHVYLVNGEQEFHFEVGSKVGYPFFGELILDCLNRTENAMTPEHAFLAAQLCLEAQANAVTIGSQGGQGSIRESELDCLNR